MFHCDAQLSIRVSLLGDTHLGACVVFLGVELRISSKSISLYLRIISALGFGIHRACRSSLDIIKF